MINGILDDLVVLDLSQGVAGPLCARCLPITGRGSSRSNRQEGNADVNYPLSWVTIPIRKRACSICF